jgi:hypothetical protein
MALARIWASILESGILSQGGASGLPQIPSPIGQSQESGDLQREKYFGFGELHSDTQDNYHD